MKNQYISDFNCWCFMSIKFTTFAQYMMDEFL